MKSARCSSCAHCEVKHITICRGVLSLTQADKVFRAEVFSYLFCHLYPPESNSTRFENPTSWASTWQTGDNSKEQHRHNAMIFFILWVTQTKHLPASQTTSWVSLSPFRIVISSICFFFFCKDIEILLRSLLPVTTILKWDAFEAIFYLSWGLLVVRKVCLNMLIRIKVTTFINWKQYPKSQCWYY